MSFSPHEETHPVFVLRLYQQAGMILSLSYCADPAQLRPAYMLPPCLIHISPLTAPVFY